MIRCYLHYYIICQYYRGYDHDCTLQQMVNMLQKNRCLQLVAHRPSFITPYAVEKSLALCGNGVVEESEECDCGLEKLCDSWNCRALFCEQVVKTWQMVSTIAN